MCLHKNGPSTPAGGDRPVEGLGSEVGGIEWDKMLLSPAACIISVSYPSNLVHCV